MTGTGAAAVPGARREATKQANRAAILAAAREAFAELGFGEASVREIVRRTDLAPGTFYNYFPDKEAVLRALLAEAVQRTRERTAAARAREDTLEGMVREGFRAYFSFLVEDPQTSRVVRRNTGTIRALLDESMLMPGAHDLQRDYDDAVARGAAPPMDSEYVAAAMTGVGLEVGVRMLEREPPDVDGATEFATRLFVGGIVALSA